ncbi:hypothetical protein, conserved [Babesia bigemina]|uniref:C3H1-type domain-containing protein n=1 Tax=Babesia bigemina TaxID=5866 RepID=A0A061BKF3_BABBI|nr:hypothetical protein, conserved [Babesia bigemina]CDR71403.1 hypothetical protein, conserved [Babesia bigemina]|eukprot:XP_012770353.1 hypothetical protein, conserved [Babesia bigemina]
MGFLSGVLGAVKDDPSVTTYYTNMDKTLKTIKDSMHKSGGLSKAVKAVSTALGEWDGEVTGRTENIKNCLNVLTNYNIPRITKALKSLRDLKGSTISQVADALDTCITEARNMSKDFLFAKASCSKLDTNLQNTLQPAISDVEVQVRAFVSAATNEELKSMLQYAEWQLEQLQTQVHGEVMSRVSDLSTNINIKFESQIKTKIEDINSRLKNHLGALNAWRENATDAVAKALEIVKEITNVLNCKEAQTEEEKRRHTPKKKAAVEEAAKKLNDKAEILIRAITTAKKLADQQTTAALESVMFLNEAVRDGLHLVKQEIQMSIWNYVREYVDVVRNEVTKIKDYGPGLLKIETEVQKWAADFSGADKFGEKVEEWVKGILEKDEYVKKLFTTYVDVNFEVKRAGVADVLKRQLVDGYIDLAGQAVEEQIQQIGSTHPDAKITGYLDAVESGINIFVQQLEGKVKDGSIHDVATKIAKAIQNNEEIVIYGKRADRPDRLFINAVKYALNQLLGVASQHSANLKWLIGQGNKEGNMKNVDAALGVANKLHENLVTATAGSSTDQALLPGLGKKKELADYYFNKDIDEALGQQLPQGYDLNGLTTTKIDISKTTTFKTYTGCIKQPVPSSGLTGKGDQEGSLPKAIGDIREKVNAELDNIKYPAHPSNGKPITTDTISMAYGEFDSSFRRFVNGITKLVGDNNSLSEDKTLLDYLKMLDRILKDDDSVYLGTIENLTKIYNDLNHLQNSAVSSLETEARNFYNDVVLVQTDFAIKYINATASTLLTNLTSEFQKKVRTDYYKKLSNILKAVSDVLTKDIMNIKNKIDEDKSNGIKGLLKWMHNGNDMYTLEFIKENSNASPNLSDKFRGYSNMVLQYVEHQANTPGQTANLPTDQSERVKDIKTVLDNLLGYLTINDTKVHNFDHIYVSYLTALNDSLSKLSPSFSSPSPLLAPLKAGLSNFTAQLGLAYVNRYSGKQFQGELLKEVKSKDAAEKPTTPKKPVFELTPEGRNCAKVCLTIVEMVMSSLTVLSINCKSLGGIQINKSTDLGKLFDGLGFIVSDQGKQNGELHDCDKILGEHISKRFTLPISGVKNNEHLILCKSNVRNKIKAFHLFNILECLSTHLTEYNKVCHLTVPTHPQYPCSVRDMLSWLAGLPFTSVYAKIESHCSKLLGEEVEDAAKRSKDPDPVISNILKGELYKTLRATCLHSYRVVNTIQGHGHGVPNADYPYACDVSNNSRNFHYPANVSGVFDMLRDICKRLWTALYFLHAQCQYTTSQANGWYDCEYGRNVSGYQWLCNTVQCSYQEGNQTPNQMGNQRCNQIGNQPCDQRPKCGVKSPLQSFLEDGLSGFLPHALTFEGTKLKCATCPMASPGTPCITPMGFGNLGYVASLSGTGKDIAAVLHFVANDADALLASLYRGLSLLCPVPPSSLSDMISFYCLLFRNWKSKTYSYNEKYVQAIKSVIESCFPFKNCRSLHNNYEAKSLTTSYSYVNCIVDNHPGYKVENEIMHYDLSGIVMGHECPSGVCIPYLMPLGHYTNHTFPAKHARLYVSWMIYLPWTFKKMLDDLLNDFHNISCKASGCLSCTCTVGKHGDMIEDAAVCNCSSIVQCGGVLRMLYKYGMTLYNASELNKRKKTCHDFYSKLKQLLNSSQFDYFFKTIDNFFFAIRAPFIWLNVALWLLSLLYLLHIMVIRLDLLHIKSHLHSPSSHRIAAQSLLAAARVGRLGKISYLQP